MKYITLLCDGMADLPVNELGGKTPMEAANKPNMNRLAGSGVQGLMTTVPAGMKPGSDVANLAMLGYDPAKYYTGRSPLEAGSIGIDMTDTDVALRCNLVTLTADEIQPDYRRKTMIDYCADDISTPEAREIVEFIDKNLPRDGLNAKFFPGVSYRHCMLWHNGSVNLGTLTPPHDITGREIGGYLSTSPEAEPILSMMEASSHLLEDLSVNKARKARGLRPANAVWLWGEGRRAALPDFYEKTGRRGGIVSAVDLLKGIGKFGGLRVIEVPGATGYLDTDFRGKANAALNALSDGLDFVYIHIEAPDECGHRGEVSGKVRAIELIDELVLGTILSEIGKISPDWKILIAPDHPTPLSTRTHSSDPVPYLIYDSREKQNGVTSFTEKTAKESGITLFTEKTAKESGVTSFTEKTAKESGNFLPHGHLLMDDFLK
ncbi:homoserine kinase [Clostridia bacterium]|nr:homoserine kinase [Clostridia bacterium]